MGQELPPLREGNVWSMQIYPGGRKVVVQVKPDRVDFVSDAARKLRAGQCVYVWLDDAGELLARLDVSKER